MIVYPLFIPSATETRESSIQLIAGNVVAVSTSPYTMQTTVYDYEAETWGLKVSINPLTREEAQPWVAFLSALRGRVGTFLFGPALFRTPLGAGTGVPLVNGANQTGRELVTDGWTANTVVLEAGDLFQIDLRLYMSLKQVTSNGSGQATIDVFPRVKAHADNSALILENPKGLWRLNSSTVPLIDAGESGLLNINFEAEEA